MKGIIVKVGDHLESKIVGVFSSKEKAEDFILRYTDNNSTSWNTPFIDGEFEIDDPILLKKNYENPIMYVSNFSITNYNGNTLVELGLDKNLFSMSVNIKTKAYAEEKFDITNISLNGFHGFVGYIVLKNKYEDEELSKIIVDKFNNKYKNNNEVYINLISKNKKGEII